MYKAIAKVWYDEPYTVVLWYDDEISVAVCQNGEKFDKEKGLMVCLLKRFMGSNKLNSVLKENC